MWKRTKQNLLIVIVFLPPLLVTMFVGWLGRGLTEWSKATEDSFVAWGRRLLEKLGLSEYE